MFLCLIEIENSRPRDVARVRRIGISSLFCRFRSSDRVKMMRRLLSGEIAQRALSVRAFGELDFSVEFGEEIIRFFGKFQKVSNLEVALVIERKRYEFSLEFLQTNSEALSLFR